MGGGEPRLIYETVTGGTQQCALPKRKSPLKLRLNGAPDFGFSGSDGALPGPPATRPWEPIWTAALRNWKLSKSSSWSQPRRDAARDTNPVASQVGFSGTEGDAPEKSNGKRNESNLLVGRRSLIGLPSQLSAGGTYG